MSNSIDLYFYAASPPCRAVQMLAEAIAVPLNLKPVDITVGEQHLPEFARINPACEVPVIDDNGFFLAESRAILPYLVDKYAAGSPLYPNAPEQRALINQRIYFDLGVLFKSFAEYFYPQFSSSTPADPTKYAAVEKSLAAFEEILSHSAYAAGETYTIADILLLATVSSFAHSDGGLDIVGNENFPNITRWFEESKAETIGWHWNEEGIVLLKQFFRVDNE